MLKNGETPPVEFTRPEIAQILLDSTAMAQTQLQWAGERCGLIRRAIQRCSRATGVRDAGTTPSLGVRHVLAPGGYLVQLWRPGGIILAHMAYRLGRRIPLLLSIRTSCFPKPTSSRRSLRAKWGLAIRTARRPAFRGRAGRDPRRSPLGARPRPVLRDPQSSAHGRTACRISIAGSPRSGGTNLLPGRIPRPLSSIAWRTAARSSSSTPSAIGRAKMSGDTSPSTNYRTTPCWTGDTRVWAAPIARRLSTAGMNGRAAGTATRKSNADSIRLPKVYPGWSSRNQSNRDADHVDERRSR